jgi:transcription elongation factor GreB
MSKAFTKDDAPPENVRRQPSGQTRYITPEGHAALALELEALLRERATLKGPDAGIDAQARRGELEARVAFLQATLEAVRVATPDPAQRGRAFLGAWVTLEDEDGERVRYRLVGPDEADARQGRVSVESPLGRALLGRQVGDEVAVERPRGRKEYAVVQVDDADPDAAQPNA